MLHSKSKTSAKNILMEIYFQLQLLLYPNEQRCDVEENMNTFLSTFLGHQQVFDDRFHETESFENEV